MKMKKWKQILCSLWMAVVLVTASVPAYAAVNDTGFSDVAANSWYREAVEYVRNKGLMSGTNDTTFAPNATTSRAMLATVLYRASGSPTGSVAANFSDVASSAYYAEAVNWAAANNIVSGYGNGLFGSNQPISREQIATILWRYAGSPVAEEGQDFTDESSIASYAADAVDWAREKGIVNGKDGNCFDPLGNATRAEVATILHNFMTKEQSEISEPTKASNTLVIYFSATGNTEAVAKYISDILSANLYEIVPQDPYSADDLDWTETSSRVNKEHENPDFRPAIAGGETDLSGYDTIFLGYPLWWREAPNIVRTFLENNDLSGKTIIPFCTSTSDGMGSSATTLQTFVSNANWLDGQRFSSRTSQVEVREWITSLKLDTNVSQ